MAWIQSIQWCFCMERNYSIIKYLISKRSSNCLNLFEPSWLQAQHFAEETRLREYHQTTAVKRTKKYLGDVFEPSKSPLCIRISFAEFLEILRWRFYLFCIAGQLRSGSSSATKSTAHLGHEKCCKTSHGKKGKKPQENGKQPWIVSSSLIRFVLPVETQYQARFATLSSSHFCRPVGRTWDTKTSKSSQHLNVSWDDRDHKSSRILNLWFTRMFWNLQSTLK